MHTSVRSNTLRKVLCTPTSFRLCACQLPVSPSTGLFRTPATGLRQHGVLLILRLHSNIVSLVFRLSPSGECPLSPLFGLFSFLLPVLLRSNYTLRTALFAWLCRSASFASQLSGGLAHPHQVHPPSIMWLQRVPCLFFLSGSHSGSRVSGLGSWVGSFVLWVDRIGKKR